MKEFLIRLLVDEHGQPTPFFSGIFWPGLLIFLWYVGTGLFNGVYDKKMPHTDAEWAALAQKNHLWAGLLSLFKTTGLNPAGGLRSLRLLTAKRFPPAMLLHMTPPTNREELEEAAKKMGKEAAAEILKQLKTGGTDAAAATVVVTTNAPTPPVAEEPAVVIDTTVTDLPPKNGLR